MSITFDLGKEICYISVTLHYSTFYHRFRIFVNWEAELVVSHCRTTY